MDVKDDGQDEQGAKCRESGAVIPALSMAAGDFCTLYNTAETRSSFMAVATVFFIDTAMDVITYIDSIAAVLEADGLWINLGPLLWHHNPSTEVTSSSDGSSSNSHEEEKYADGNGDGIEGSVELTLEEVLTVVQKRGFEIEKCEMIEDCRYVQAKATMFHTSYNPVFWIARRL